MNSPDVCYISRVDAHGKLTATAHLETAMYSVRISLFSLAFALISCASDEPTSPRRMSQASADAALDRRGVAAVPMSGQCDLAVNATTPFPAPPIFRQVASGTCELAHIGRADVHFVQVVNFAAGTQHSLELTYKAANGDVLRAQSAGTSIANAGTVRFQATIKFLAGTGRFADASGEAGVVGTADLAAGTSHYVLDGRIAYDASDRHP